MIPRLNQPYLYRGEPVTVVAVDLTAFPTRYTIQWSDASGVRQAFVDDIAAFTAAPLPDTMSEMERLQEENMKLRARVAELEGQSLPVNLVQTFLKSSDILDSSNFEEKRQNALWDIYLCVEEIIKADVSKRRGKNTGSIFDNAC